MNSELLNLYLFALAIFKASLITGLLPAVAVTLYMERKRKQKFVVIEFPHKVVNPAWRKAL